MISSRLINWANDRANSAIRSNVPADIKEEIKKSFISGETKASLRDKLHLAFMTLKKIEDEMAPEEKQAAKDAHVAKQAAERATLHNTMMKLRWDNGRSNGEIARACGVSYPIVRKNIGLQPRKISVRQDMERGQRIHERAIARRAAHAVLGSINVTNVDVLKAMLTSIKNRLANGDTTKIEAASMIEVLEMNSARTIGRQKFFETFVEVFA